MKARLTGAALGLGTMGVVLGVLLSSAPALAQDGGTDGSATDGGTTVPNCNDTSMFPNPIYLAGSSAIEPVVQKMGAALKDRKAPDGTTPAPVTLIFQSIASCNGPSAIKANSNLTGQATYYVTPTGTAGRLKCSLDAAPPKVDVGISDVFYETCGLGARPANIGDFVGPVQAMLFIVPIASQAQTNITFEEAADVWGCGARAGVSPWVVETAIQQRNSTSGTQNVIARSINVLASSFHGTMNAAGGDLITTITGGNPMVTISDPSTAIGFLAADSYDTRRQTLRSLAFRASEQTQAYFADSTPDSFDKRNVRDGHYVAWGYEHLITIIDPATGKPTSAAARNFIDWMQGNPITVAADKPNFDPIDLQSSTSVIPLCAMQVQRKSDGGFLSAYTPADSCSCLFEAKATQSTPTGCLPCTDDTTCTGGKKCHHGYCE